MGSREAYPGCIPGYIHQGGIPGLYTRLYTPGYIHREAMLGIPHYMHQGGYAGYTSPYVHPRVYLPWCPLYTLGIPTMVPVVHPEVRDNSAQTSPVFS